jgi:hypothetical protein
MKKMLLFVCLSWVSSVFAQQPDKGQLAQVIQKCIDLPALQQHLPADNSGNVQQLYVYYYHPVLVPTDILLSKGGKTLQFNEVTQPLNDITTPFFLFHSVNSDSNTASVTFSFYYDHANGQKKINVSVVLQKANDTWNITSSTINN